MLYIIFLLKDHIPNRKDTYVNVIDYLSVVAERLRDNELSVDDISRDQSRQVIPWQRRLTGESWMGKHSVSPGT